MSLIVLLSLHKNPSFWQDMILHTKMMLCQEAQLYSHGRLPIGVLPFDDYREIGTPPDWWAISPVLPFDDYREIEKFKSEEGDKSPLNLSTL